MSRATHWQPLCETDPTPGEPHEVVHAGRHYSEMADEIKGQIEQLKDIVGGTLEGGYVQTLTEAADGLKDQLGQIHDRYREVGGVLEHWGHELEGFQVEAEGLRRQAESAQGAMDANRVTPQPNAVAAPPPPDAEVPAVKARQGRYDEACDDLSRIHARLVDLTDRRDAAAHLIADAIRGSCDDEMVDSGWDNFQNFFHDWVHTHAEQLKAACTILGYVALAACFVALFVPGLNIAAAAGIAAWAGAAGAVATASSLLIHTALVSTGDGNWVDVGMDAVALATLGTGRFLTSGFKVSAKVMGKGFSKQFGGALERLTGDAKTLGAEARGSQARAAVQETVTADVARANAGLAERVGQRGWVRRTFLGKLDAKLDAVKLESEVNPILARGEKAMDNAYTEAKDAYAAQKITAKGTDGLALGGGHLDAAASRMTARDAARGFSPESAVGQAAAKADAKGAQAALAMKTSNGTTLWSVGTDQAHIKPYDDWKDRWTKEGGYL